MNGGARRESVLCVKVLIKRDGQRSCQGRSALAAASKPINNHTKYMTITSIQRFLALPETKALRATHKPLVDFSVTVMAQVQCGRRKRAVGV